MFMLFLVATICVSIGLITVLLWSKIQFDWLSKTCKYLAWSLPFEYFPKLEVAGASFRVSQLLVILGVYFLIVLGLKKDKHLLNHQLHWASFYPLFFIALSSPSWLFITDYKRFLVHFVATNLVFGAMILLMNFGINPYTNSWQRLKELAVILTGCGVFGLYQYVGDLVGIPSFLTGLREQYTKIVFGVPRVQGTAIEPLYFAGMLLVAMFILWFWWLQEIQKRPHSSFPPLRGLGDKLEYKIPAYFVVVLVAFVLTISKGTFAVLVLLIPVVLTLSYVYFGVVREFVRKIWIFALGVAILGVIFLGVFFDPAKVFGEVGQNFVETIAGTSASAVERSRFVGEALAVLPQNLVLGIGMGQYADYVGTNLGNINTEESKAIVNNVYLEVLLEEGFLAFCWFLFMIFLPIFLMIKQLVLQSPKDRESIVLCLVLIPSLIAYCVQWTLFSPIFIMPIFILLGLGYGVIKD